MRTPPKGYASTAVWAAFDKWADRNSLEEDNAISDDPSLNWFDAWEAFRDGYSAGLAEQDI